MAKAQSGAAGEKVALITGASGGTALYNATKHAVEGYSESLDHELRTFGIRVSPVEPVFTRTARKRMVTSPIGS